MRPVINHRKILLGFAITLANKRKNIVYQFKELDDDITRIDAELLLLTIIDDWKSLVMRFSLTEHDDSSIHRCMFYADRIIKKFPSIERKFFFDYYEEAMCEYIGVKYVFRRDKQSQEKLGFEPLIYFGDILYLFPLE